MTKMIQTFYISTGAKNAMFTLRCSRALSNSVLPEIYGHDFYIRNLAATEELAAAKAVEWVEAFKQRVGDDEDRVIIFDPIPEHDIQARRGKLSAADTRMIETIEAGIAPFGKHNGAPIIDLPESYILFFADKSHEVTRPVMMAFSAACLGVALEKGYIALRDERKAKRLEEDKKSNFVGEEGQRMQFSGVVESSFYKEPQDSYSDGYHINKIRCGDDIVMYFGKQLGQRGQNIVLTGTIKRHSEYNGIKSTQINRPKVNSLTRSASDTEPQG